LVQAGIEIEDLNYDGAELHLELRASNGSFVGTMDLYCNEEDLIQFGNDLQRFPKSSRDTATFELGEDNEIWAHYLCIKAHVIDGVGHSALRLTLSTRSTGPWGGRAEFEILSEPASLNRFGKELAIWAKDRGEILSWQPGA